MTGLVTHVAVQDGDGVTHSFGPGSTVPEWAARKLTNPKLWDDGEAPYPATRAEGVDLAPPAAPQEGVVSLVPTQELEDRIVTRVLAGVAQLIQDIAVLDGDDDDSPAGDGPPPLEGKGSGVTAWRKYAAEHKVDVEGLDRDEIVAKLQEEGVSVDRD